MFFILSKTAAFLLLPSNFLITLGFIGVVLMATRFKRVGRWLAGASLILLLVAGFSPAGRLLFNALENRFPRWHSARARIIGNSRAQCRRKRPLHQGPGQTESGRALAAGDVGMAHAAGGRLLPADRISGRGLSGRLRSEEHTSEL